MKSVFISFNQAYYEAILDIMKHCDIKGFTRWDVVQGRGSHNGEPHFGSHAWPTLNSAILAVVEDSRVPPFLDALHELDVATEAQGLRAFVWNVEQAI
jgi:nitrogen regulatory protein PII